MPVGPYTDFPTCMTALQNKGYSKDAAQGICGKLEQQSRGAKASDNDRLFVRAFLIDASKNMNNWRVSRDSIERNINTFVGKPLVLTEKYDHPGVDDSGVDTVGHWLAYQETFRVGNIIDIVSKPSPANPNASAQAYHAIIEITHPEVKQALRNNTIPVYVSAGLAVLPDNPNRKTAVSVYEPVTDGELIDNWLGMHLAIVDQPAYGIKKAFISHQCGGDEKACMLQLRQAHISKYGAGNCGFCVKKAMDTLRIVEESRNNATKLLTANSVMGYHTSHATLATASKAVNLSQLEPTDSSSVATTTATANNDVGKTTINQPVSPNAGDRVEVVERPNFVQNVQPHSKQPVHLEQQGSTPSTIIEMAQTIQNQKQEIELLRIQNQELSNDKGTLSERVAAMEMKDRRREIEGIITPEIIKDDKTRLEKIKFFTSSTIPVDQIAELFNGLRVQLRKASASYRGGLGGGRVQYGISLGGGGGVASSNNPNASQTLDDSGLTQLQKQLALLRGGP